MARTMERVRGDDICCIFIWTKVEQDVEQVVNVFALD
jgi:hypothetical protein